jgi:hypothetical protein
MPPKLNLLALTALTVLVCVLPATVATAEILPPGNSAVNQYTETFPTSKGEEKSELEKKTGVKPGDVLGAGKTRKLDEKGAAGKAVAQFTAETAPASSSDSGSTGGETTGGDNGGKGKENGKGQGKGKQPNHGGKSEGGGEQQEGSAAGGGSTSAGSGGGSGPAGASAVGEIASQATGTASDSIGLWLPLILIAVVIWSGFYVWRNRQQQRVV